MLTSRSNKNGRVRRLTVSALTLSVALILSYVEAMLPSLPVPGVKLGLANVAVVFALYSLGEREAAAVSLLRVVIVGILFGNAASFAYSCAGALLSLAFMLALKKTGAFSQVGVSVAGGIAHNAGQIAMAAVILGTGAVVYYLPVLIVSGLISGAAVGFLGGVVSRRISVKTALTNDKNDLLP